MCDRRTLVRLSIGLYTLLLRMYPGPFRKRFKDEMTVVFEQWLGDESTAGPRGLMRVWVTTIKDLAASLVREHYEALSLAGCTTVAATIIRTAAAIAVPLGVYVLLLQFAPRTADTIVLTLWFLAMAIGMTAARGRGWACSRNAMSGAAVGVGLPILWTGLTETSTPSVFALAPLLLLAAATVGLILSTFVRLAIEGVRLPHRPAAAT